MNALLVLLLLLAQDPAVSDQVVSVGIQSVGSRESASVLLSRPEVAATVRRDGDRVVIDLAAALALDMPTPASSRHIQRVSFERVGEATSRITLDLAPGSEHEVVRRGDQLSVLVGPVGERAAVSDVYGLLFPETPLDDTEAPPVEATDDDGAGVATLDPSLAVLHISGRNSFPTGATEPQEDSYLEARPRLDAGLGVGILDLRPGYEFRIRRGSRFEENNDHSHLATLGLAAPVGPALRLTGSYEFVRGRAEVAEADPGSEFFHGRSRFTKHEGGLDLAWELGALTRVFARGEHRRLSVDDEDAFVSHQRTALGAGVRRDVGPRLVADLAFDHERIPGAVDRAIIEARTNSVSLLLRGDLTPRLTGTASVGYARRTSPQAPAAARDRSDLTAAVTLRQELTPSMNVRLNLGRSQNVSAFDQNPFFVAETASLDATVPLPLEVVLTVSGGTHRNTYPVVSPTLGEARRDRIRSWGAGLARPFGAWGYLRADYSKSQRRSNVPGLSFDSDGLTVQLVLRPFNRDAETRQ